MYLKLQLNLTAIIPDICACSETAWAWVGEMCVKKHVKVNCHSLQIYTWNLIWSAHEKVCETASELLLPFDHCEVICETSCEVHVKMCMKGIELFHTLFTYLMWSTREKACETESELLLQLMWTYMWNLMWSICANVCERDYIVSQPFHIIFTYISLC